MDESKQILMTVTEVRTDLKNLSEQMKEFSKVTGTIVQIAESTKSAHNRIDDLKTDYESKLKAQKEDYEKKLADQKEDYEDKIQDQKDNLKELKGHITWLWRAVGGGGISLIFGLILFFVTK